MKGEIRHVAIIGTGTLGTQIAIQTVLFGYNVTTYDADPKAFLRSYKGLKRRLEAGLERSSFTLDQWASGVEKIRLCSELSEALKNTDLVIEAVFEDLDLKREIFKKIDAVAPKKAILATNSSSIPISRIEMVTKRPEQCLNIHFYQPLMGINMVDIMGGTKTTADIFEIGKAWISSIGCVPLTVKKEILGFCFNRVWRAVKREVLHMWAEGYVDFRDIDRAWMIANGTNFGPFGRMDRVGLDVVYDIEMVYFNDSKDPKDHPPDALKAKIEKKELGVKTNKGFYTYPNPEYSQSDFLEG